MARQNYSNTDIIEGDTDTTIVSKSKNRENNPQAGPNISILSCLQSSKATKRHWANTVSPQRKFDIETIAKIENALDVDEGSQITLLQYTLTAPVVCKLGRL